MQTHRPCPRPMESDSALEQDPLGESHAHGALASSHPISHAMDACKEPTTHARAFI